MKDHQYLGTQVILVASFGDSAIACLKTIHVA
jgi:hypothetical protein